jgi:hypothetical protein
VSSQIYLSLPNCLDSYHANLQPIPNFHSSINLCLSTSLSNYFDYQQTSLTAFRIVARVC